MAGSEFWEAGLVAFIMKFTLLGLMNRLMQLSFFMHSEGVQSQEAIRLEQHEGWKQV